MVSPEADRGEGWAQGKSTCLLLKTEALVGKDLAPGELADVKKALMGLSSRPFLGVWSTGQSWEVLILGGLLVKSWKRRKVGIFSATCVTARTSGWIHLGFQKQPSCSCCGGKPVPPSFSSAFRFF